MMTVPPEEIRQPEEEIAANTCASVNDCWPWIGKYKQLKPTVFWEDSLGCLYERDNNLTVPYGVCTFGRGRVNWCHFLPMFQVWSAKVEGVCLSEPLSTGSAFPGGFVQWLWRSERCGLLCRPHLVLITLCVFVVCRGCFLLQARWNVRNQLIQNHSGVFKSKTPFLLSVSSVT